MHNRRVFLQSSAAAVSAVLAWQRGISAPADGSGASPFDVIVVDKRIADADGFSARSAPPGATIVSIGDDVSELWYGDLHSRLRQQKAIVAGLTSEQATFNLRSLARDVHYTQIFRGDHLLGGIRAQHRITGPAYLSERGLELNMAGEVWASELGRLMSDYDPSLPNGRISTFAAHVHARSDDPNRLVSWIFAPIYR